MFEMIKGPMGHMFNTPAIEHSNSAVSNAVCSSCQNVAAWTADDEAEEH